MQQLFGLIFLIQPYVFQATNSPILRSIFDCIYSFWYNEPTLLPAGTTSVSSISTVASCWLLTS